MKRGFTLFEIVAVLVLIGIAGAVGGLMLTSTIQRFSLEREAAAMNQKVEAAMARMIKEITWADPETVTVSGGATLAWTSRHPSRVGEGARELSWSGAAESDLLLDGNPLLDKVTGFSVSDTVTDGYLEISVQTALTPSGHQTRIYLRDDI